MSGRQKLPTNQIRNRGAGAAKAQSGAGKGGSEAEAKLLHLAGNRCRGTEWKCLSGPRAPPGLSFLLGPASHAMMEDAWHGVIVSMPYVMSCAFIWLSVDTGPACRQPAHTLFTQPPHAHRTTSPAHPTAPCLSGSTMGAHVASVRASRRPSPLACHCIRIPPLFIPGSPSFARAVSSFSFLFPGGKTGH